MQEKLEKCIVQKGCDLIVITNIGHMHSYSSYVLNCCLPVKSAHVKCSMEKLEIALSGFAPILYPLCVPTY